MRAGWGFFRCEGRWNIWRSGKIVGDGNCCGSTDGQGGRGDCGGAGCRLRGWGVSGADGGGVSGARRLEVGKMRAYGVC